MPEEAMENGLQSLVRANLLSPAWGSQALVQGFQLPAQPLQRLGHCVQKIQDCPVLLCVPRAFGDRGQGPPGLPAPALGPDALRARGGLQLLWVAGNIAQSVPGHSGQPLEGAQLGLRGDSIHAPVPKAGEILPVGLQDAPGQLYPGEQGTLPARLQLRPQALVQGAAPGVHLLYHLGQLWPRAGLLPHNCQPLALP